MKVRNVILSLPLNIITCFVSRFHSTHLWKLCLFNKDIESHEYGKRQTWIVSDLYHVTNFSLTLRFTVHYLYHKINSFALVLSITIGLNCFYLHVVYIEKLSTWIWRLPFAVNGTLNLSNVYPNRSPSNLMGSWP